MQLLPLNQNNKKDIVHRCNKVNKIISKHNHGVPSNLDTISVEGVANAASMEYTERDPVQLRHLCIVANLIYKLRTYWLQEDWEEMKAWINNDMYGSKENVQALNDSIVPIEIQKEIQFRVMLVFSRAAKFKKAKIQGACCQVNQLKLYAIIICVILSLNVIILILWDVLAPLQWTTKWSISTGWIHYDSWFFHYDLHADYQ